MNVAIQRKDTAVLPQARRLAKATDTEVRLRMSSIGALGELGTAEDVSLLETLTRDIDGRIKRVAVYQLKSLRKRCAAKQL